ncbi:SdrD B-like domain-containing protein [Microcoleus sp. MON2_D6]|uniref:SdrD B-like domain-containing protein n=1 Tax=unclassified Microcoleus TaxID=2642155 RepID=UPI002FD2C746
MTSNINEELELERRAKQLQPVVVGNAGPAILGIKFNDRDADGIRDSNEEGLRDITILLEPANTSNGVFNANAGEAQATTNVNGAFSFINLVPGNYVLTETNIPAGFSPTTPNPLAVTVVGDRNVNVLFGNTATPGSRIVGCKYLDIDNDGFRDGDEPGIKNVRIYLDINGNGQFDAGTDRETLTDKNGQWSFDVAPGTYKVREERLRPPAPNSVLRIQDSSVPPTAEPLERDFPQSTPPDSIPLLDVTVAAGETFACAQVGNTPLYQIEVIKFEDRDRSGTRNVVNGFLEPAVARVPFVLDLNENGRWDEGSEPIAITDLNGRVIFRDLFAGTYPVLEIFPSVLPAAVGGGTPGNLNLPVPTTPNPTLVTAPGPQARYQGTISREQPLLVADPDYELKPNDPKFVDDNFDGVQQAGERSIADTGERPIFANTPVFLPATNPQPSLTFSPVGVNQGIGDNSGVGNTRPNINIFKYNDLNANGRYEPTFLETGALDPNGERPIAGVTVFLDANNDGTPSDGEQQIQTNTLGRAAFTNLPVGNYVVREVAQPNFSPSTPDRVDVTLNTQDANVTFANTPSSNITGCKFEDFNQNGYRDGNEPAISGVTIAIDTNRDGVLQADEPTSITNEFGIFSFTNLTPGLYSIREVTPPGFFKTTQQVDVVLGANQTFTCALVGNSRFYDLSVPKFQDDDRNGIRNGNEQPLANIPFTLDLNRNGRYDPATEPLVRTDAAGIALFPNLLPGTYSVLEVFDPSVENPFPIPTGPNPVNFNVPGPNAVPTPATPPPPSGVITLSSIQGMDDLTGDPQKVETPTDDLLLNGGSVAQSIPGFDNTIVLENAGAANIIGKKLEEGAQAAILPFLAAQRDESLFVGAPEPTNLLF